MRSVERLRHPAPSSVLWRRTREGALLGAVFGAILLTVGLASAALAVAFGARVSGDGWRDLLLAGAYVAAFALAGGLAGALSPVRRTWWGALLIGYVCAGVVAAALGGIALALDRSLDLGFYVSYVGFIMLAFGTLAAYHIRKSQGES